MALPSGFRIGSYEIVGLLGVGGMGEVYRARDTKLGRDVAIKVLPDSLRAIRNASRGSSARRRCSPRSVIPTSPRSTDSSSSTTHRFLVLEFVEGDSRWRIG